MWAHSSRVRPGEYLGAVARGKLSITYDGPSQFIFPTDEILLGRIFDNLVVNGIKHSPPGESVTITPTTIRGRNLIIRVIDTGEGMTPGDLQHLFRKNGRIEGQNMERKYDTGLGLVFCRMAVDLLHGSITVKASSVRAAHSRSNSDPLRLECALTRA